MVKDTDILLTTKDNPYNPFTEYDDWKYFDETQKHYNTEAYVAREVGMLDPDIGDEALAHEMVEAFKEIIKLNNELGVDIYTMITRDGERLDPSPSEFLGESPVSEEAENEKEGTPGEGPQEAPAP